MPSYSSSSKRKLLTVHQDEQTIFNYVIQILDNTIVFGLRTAEEQFELYKKGRTLVGDKWVVTRDRDVVTYKDGYESKSRHQSGTAIDVIPYPGGWQADEKKFFELAGVIKSAAFFLKKYGAIEHDIDWGYDLWGWDLAHFQLRI